MHDTIVQFSVEAEDSADRELEIITFREILGSASVLESVNQKLNTLVAHKSDYVISLPERSCVVTKPKDPFPVATAVIHHHWLLPLGHNKCPYCHRDIELKLGDNKVSVIFSGSYLRIESVNLCINVYLEEGESKDVVARLSFAAVAQLIVLYAESHKNWYVLPSGEKKFKLNSSIVPSEDSCQAQALRLAQEAVDSPRSTIRGGCFRRFKGEKKIGFYLSQETFTNDFLEANKIDEMWLTSVGFDVNNRLQHWCRSDTFKTALRGVLIWSILIQNCSGKVALCAYASDIDGFFLVKEIKVKNLFKNVQRDMRTMMAGGVNVLLGYLSQLNHEFAEEYLKNITSMPVPIKSFSIRPEPIQPEVHITPDPPTQPTPIPSSEPHGLGLIDITKQAAEQVAIKKIMDMALNPVGDTIANAFGDVSPETAMFLRCYLGKSLLNTILLTVAYDQLRKKQLPLISDDVRIILLEKILMVMPQYHREMMDNGGAMIMGLLKSIDYSEVNKILTKLPGHIDPKQLTSDALQDIFEEVQPKGRDLAHTIKLKEER